MEKSSRRKETAEDLFCKFMDAEDCPEITHTFRRLVQLLGIKAENPREFYCLLKGKLQSWKCKSLWELLDCRANQKEYGKGKICEDIQVLVIGAGPIGLRTAIEVALLGAQVVIVEKRESFVRNNVLHLWPFLLTDFRSLGAKKFYGKFCSGSIDHISIRKLQAVLLKTALIFGAKLYTGVTFENVIEPNSVEDGWKCKVSPDNHPVSAFEFDVLIGADGKKNVIPGFQQIEMRGTLAIGITANFVNHGTEEEANVEEISGIAYQFNPQFFDDLHAQKGIKLENIVYYKDETHYFVMTAGKASLLKRGALKEDLGQPTKLLSPCNIDYSKLLEYVTDVVKYATKGTLKNLELKIVGNNQPDIAAFDFTSIRKAEHAARIIERKGSKLLVGLVGDSLLEPFWPTGSGCARGVLSALDAAWMIRSFAQDKPPLQILSERENIYRLLSGTSTENLHKDHAKYTINPSTRYLNITHKRIREVYHLYDTDDAVNADFSIGSPQTAVNNKASRRRRISTGAKYTSSKGRKRGQASSHPTAEFGARRIRSTSGSIVENLDSHKPLSATRSIPLDSTMRGEYTTLSSAGSDDEVFEKKTRRVRINPRASPSTVRGRSSTVGSSGDELRGKRKKSARKRTLSKENLDNPKDGTRRKKGFFGFGKSKPKRKAAEDSDYHSDKESKLFKVKHGEEHETVDPSTDLARDDSWRRRPAGAFSREQYTRRSARDIIREMEARSKGEVIGNGITSNEKMAVKALDSKILEKEGEMKRKEKADNREVEERLKMKKEEEKKKHKEDEKKRKEEERKRKDEEKRKQEEEKKRKEENEKARKKKEEEINNLHNKKAHTTPTNKKSKKQILLDEIAKISPSVKRAMPVLSKLSPELDKESEKTQEHSVTSAVREAAMLLMATPLLIDGLLPKKELDRKGSWLTRSSGRVRDVVQRYNTLNDLKPALINSMNGDVTPLKRPRDSADGPEDKPRKLNSNNEEEDGNENYSEDLNDSCNVQSTPPSQKRKTLQIKKDERHLVSSPSLERLKIKLQDYQDDVTGDDKNSSSPNSPNGKPPIDFNSPIWQKTPIAAMTEIKERSKENELIKTSKTRKEDSKDRKSTEDAVSTPEREHVVKDSSSTIWQKTVIAAVAEKSEDNKENDKESLVLSTIDDKVPEKQLPKTSSSQTRRRSSVSPSELMEEKLANLLNNTTAQRAWESIKYMISLFKQIQKHPSEEKYYRIFKGRVKFRKHVWTVRNAKLFMTASGWTEVGSFVIFPLSKQIEGPLLLLNKYLSIADEKIMEQQSNSEKENHPNLRKTSSSDLAEKITELKEALVSSRSNSYKLRRMSWEKNTRSTLLHRTVSMDEVSNLRRTTEESHPPLNDSKYTENEFQKLQNRLEEEKRREYGSNLRRSVSENALYDDDDAPPVSPLIRRFSQRRVKEQKVSSDLVMENPINVETSSNNKKQEQRSTSSLDDQEVTDIPTCETLSPKQYPDRQAVRSPREAVLEEADHLSSVLGNILETLGSSTDSERESESEKEAKKEPEKGKETKTIADKHKDEELEALCETLDLLIQDNSSNSSSESENDGITNGKRYNLRQAESRKSAFKPPMYPTKRTTRQLGKTKSSDSVENSRQSSMTNGRLNRERVTKAKSVDVASLGSNGRPQKSTMETGQNISKMVPKTDEKTVPKKVADRRQSSVKTRAQGQRDLNSSRLSKNTNRKQHVSSKRKSSVDAKPPAVKRPVSKAKSVDVERPRPRPLPAKSKSVDCQENGLKATGRSQPKTRSGRSSGSEGDKKPLRRRNAERTRVQPTRQSSAKGKRRTSLGSNAKGQGRKSSTDEERISKEREPSKCPDEGTASKDTSSKMSSPVEHPVVREEHVVNSEVAPVIEKPLSQKEHDESDRNSDLMERGKDKCKEENSQEFVSWQPEDENQDSHDSKDILAENNDEIVKLSNEIRDHYSKNAVQSDGDVNKKTVDEFSKGRRSFPSEPECHDLVQEREQPLPVEREKDGDETDSRIKEDGNPDMSGNTDLERTHSQSSNRKMTLLNLGKQQSKDRLARKEVVSLSLEERKQLILEAAVTKPKSKPAKDRRSILQIQNRNDGKLVKNKKEAFEKPNVTRLTATSNGSEDKSSKRRHFRFHGRRKKSFESSNEQLEVVPEDHEEEFEEKTHGIIPPKREQDTRIHNGVTAEPKTSGQKIEKNVDKGKSRSPIKISPFQLHFTKRKGSYDLEKRASTSSLESQTQYPGEYE